jgi:NADH-quinone oxidoreductase subunit N
MNLDAVKQAAADNTWLAIFPELMLGCIALILLVLETVLPKKHHAVIADVASAGILGTLIGLVMNWNTRWLGTTTFSGLIHITNDSQVMRAFFLLAALLVCMLARIALAKQLMPRVEFYHILLVITAAMMLLAHSNHFVMLFVALETLTIGLYILVSYFRTNPASLEAGLKYLIMGALSSGLLLFGIVLLYGVAGNPSLPAHTAQSMNYAELARFLAANPNNFVASLGIVLVLAGVAFKIGAFPFQIWIPDVYQGAPTPVTAFLAVASKAAGFSILIGLCGAGGPFGVPEYSGLVMPVLTAMAAATIIFGNIAALTQHNVKRLIGLSGVAHAGFLLLGVAAVASSPLATGAVYFYLFAYLIASFAVFGVMTHLAGVDDSDQELEHYAGLARESPFLATVLAVGLGSLAGIPPLAGFMGKLLVFIAAFQAGARGLLVIAAIGVVISIYYYFGWIKAAFFETWIPPDDSGTATRRPRTPIGVGAGLTLGALALASVVLGFYQGPLGAWLTSR